MAKSDERLVIGVELQGFGSMAEEPAEIVRKLWECVETRNLEVFRHVSGWWFNPARRRAAAVGSTAWELLQRDFVMLQRPAEEREWMASEAEVLIGRLEEVKKRDGFAHVVFSTRTRSAGVDDGVNWVVSAPMAVA